MGSKKKGVQKIKDKEHSPKKATSGPDQGEPPQGPSRERDEGKQLRKKE